MRKVRALLYELWEGTRSAVGSLFAHRLRALLTTLGILIGVATVIGIMGIIDGLDRAFASQVTNLGAQTLYVSRRPWVTRDGGWRFRQRRPITRTELDAIRSQATLIEAAAPVTDDLAEIHHGDKQLDRVLVVGTTAEYASATPLDLEHGRFLVPEDDENGRSVVVLGADVRDALFGKEADGTIGARVMIDGRPMEVVGVLERKGKMLDWNMDAQVFVPYAAFARFFGARRSITIAATAVDVERISEAEDELIGILRRSRGLSPERENDFAVNRQETLTRVYRQLTGALFSVAVGVGLITLIVGGIGIMNILMVSVTERTREIGVRRAIGATRRAILIQFLAEAVLVSAFGGALGTALGLGLAQVVSALTPLAAAATPRAIVLGLSFSGVVGVFFGLLPAWRAANLDVVEALRYE